MTPAEAASLQASGLIEALEHEANALDALGLRDVPGYCRAAATALQSALPTVIAMGGAWQAAIDQVSDTHQGADCPGSSCGFCKALLLMTHERPTLTGDTT